MSSNIRDVVFFSTPPRPLQPLHPPIKLPHRIHLLFLAILLLAFIVRVTDFTDPPLDFNPTRQLRSAIIARGIYYTSLPSADSQTRELALSHWYALERLDPPILERLVAFTYRLMGNEQLWVVRVYTIGFWLAGGGALFALALRFASSWGALVGLGYYLFLPLGVFASRAFQPDPGMVAAALFAALSLAGLGEWYYARKGCVQPQECFASLRLCDFALKRFLCRKIGFARL